MIFATDLGSFATLILSRNTVPLSMGRRVSIISSVVVLPAPLGPRMPKISPSLTVNEMLFTTLVLPYFFVRLCTSIMFI